MAAPCLALFLALFLAQSGLLSASDARAQDEAPVVVGWVEVPPLLSSNEAGEPEGFSVDLIERAAEIAGFEYRFQHYDDIPSYFAAQVSGETQVQPGVAALPVLRDTNLFSDPVGQTLIRLFVRADRADDPDYAAPPVDKRIGIARPSAGSENSALLQRNRQVDLPNDSTLLIHLLRGWIDGVVIPQERLMAAAHTIGLDHRVAPVGEVVREFDRVFAVHESRADLIPRINAAIAQMAESGELAAMQERWFLTVPPSNPEVLTVGISHSPPYQVIRDNGTITGFAVDVLKDLAKLADLRLSFTVIDAESWSRGPRAGEFDLLPQARIDAERRARMDFTAPIEQAPLSILVRHGDASDIAAIDDLVGRKVGVVAGSLGERVASSHAGLQTVVAADQDALLGDLLDGRTDAVLFLTRRYSRANEILGVVGETTVVGAPVLVSERAVALRRGLGSVRETLNTAIAGYLISDRYQALQQRWFGKPLFWTPTLIYLAVGATGLLVLGLLGYLFWQRQRQRQRDYERQQRELERERVHARQLGRLVTELERSNRELDEFAYTASHDLKEPLRGIAINADFLGREALSERGRQRVSRMIELSARMEQLISDLLFFSRLGRGERVTKDVDAKHVIDGIGTELSDWLAERNGGIAVATALPRVHAEHSKVKTLFRNLIVNGLKYNDARTKTVEIGFDAEAEVNDATLRNVFWVRDNGIGIAEKNRDKVFRMFQRLNPEEDYGPGTGAGLSFVRKIAEQYGGAITFTSQPGSGSTFYVTLPLAEIAD